jgi:hypothetical protein
LDNSIYAIERISLDNLLPLASNAGDRGHKSAQVYVTPRRSWQAEGSIYEESRISISNRYY